MDHPDNPISITNLSVPSNLPWVGDAAVLNSIVPDDVYIFCVSEHLAQDLYTEFKCNTCVEITNPSLFLGRIQRAVAKRLSFRQYGMLHGSVYYYAPNRKAPADISEPLNIPFFKHVDYSPQKEFRFVLPLKNSLKVTKSIVHWKLYSFKGEVESGISKDMSLQIGSIGDIVKTYRN